MHRHTTARPAEHDDAHRGVQASPRADVSADQQSVLNLQQGAGNSLTGQIVQRSPQVIRRAGDKLSFERGTELQDDEALAGRVADAIEAERAEKRQVKDKLETDKELEINSRHDKSEEKKAAIRSRKGIPPDLLKVLVSLEEAQTITEHKGTLGRYHDDVQQTSGWKWERLSGRLKSIDGISFDAEPKDGKILITATGSGRKIYTIYFEKERFNPVADGTLGREQVFTKRGYANDGSMPAKEFVEDANKVKTRRIVTRAVTIWHLASMFGLKFVDTDFKTGETGVAPDYQDDLKQRRTDAQMPRYTGTAFGGHADTFDLQEAVGYNPPGSEHLPKSEFMQNYDPRDPGMGRDEKPLPRGERTGLEFTTGRKAGRGRGHDMGTNEKASMQVRNGSGNNQPFLSTASVQVDPTSTRPQKVIRANKGERFDTGAENQATVKVDLAKAKEAGVTIVNQHDDESNRHKIAWDRYYDQDDVKELGRRFALAKQHESEFPDEAAQVRPTESDLKIFDHDDQELIRAGKGDEVVAKKYTKRSAPKELDEYIYSARKNREVLMDKIPLGCVTEIYLNKEGGKWPDPPMEVGVWHKFPEVQGALKAYLRGTVSEDAKEEQYARIQQMFQIAIQQKELEGGTRV